MMKNLFLSSVLLLALGAGCVSQAPVSGPAAPPAAPGTPSTATPQAPTARQPVGGAALASCEKIITTKDVENLTGITPIVVIPRNPRIGAGGQCNFGTDDKTLVLLVNILSAADFASARAQFGETAKAVSGIGEEAFTVGDYNLYVKKGSVSVSAGSFFRMPEYVPYLTMEQLKVIVNFMLGKL